MNVIALWLKLIGTPERARKLRARVDGLASPPVDPSIGLEAPQCPTTVLFGAETSRKLYADPEYRPALDAWDTGEVSRGDLRRYCQFIEKGGYVTKDATLQWTGPIFYPDAFWLASRRSANTWNVFQAESILQARSVQTEI